MEERKYKILIVDDEEDIVMVLEDILSAEGYTVTKAHNGGEAIKMASGNPDLILLDIMLPGLDGYDVCRAIRDQFAGPIVFMSAKKEEFDRLKGFAFGGDDYVTKPFSLNELLARIRAHLRREERANSDHMKAILRFNRMMIDLKCREVIIDNKEIQLTKREFDIIELLALHPGQVFSREQIYESIWGIDALGDSATVTEFIKKIRLKFSEADPAGTYISTLWGVGYKWERALG